MSEPKVFNLSEANEMVPVLADLTAQIVQKLDGIRQRHKIDPGSATSSVPERILREVEGTLQEWAEKVVELGAFPKGYFTVDFQSVDPEMLYCWSYGEDKIGFTHKVWENFTHRRPLLSNLDDAGDHLKWVN